MSEAFAAAPDARAVEDGGGMLLAWKAGPTACGPDEHTPAGNHH